MNQQWCVSLISNRVASGNFGDSGQNFVYFTEEFVVFWGGEKGESALTHDKHMLWKRKRKSSTKHSALGSSFPLKLSMRNLDTVSHQQSSCKKYLNDTNLTLLVDLSWLLCFWPIKGFLVYSENCFLHRNGHESSWLCCVGLLLSLHHGLKVIAEMLDMPLYLVTTWELQMRKILFVPF